ncbi:WD40-repeat-containing domain protein [Suillus placidus]|uniref:WD40-repeat-containing domain protein n=1 Tax=Suillus placidus TaxID=48579 RepID=A0A9P6ZXG5_9AGAM|nr:WD40-repeat-containing domain protein [Suillus placidus]
MPSSANELGLVPVIFDANREEQKVSAVAFLFRDQHIVTGSRDGCLQVREAKTGKSVGDPWQDKERSEICAIDVSPNGNHVATGSKNGKIRVWIWNGRTAAIVGESKEHSSAALCVRWSRHNNGAHIASGFDDGSIAVWSFTASGLKRPMSTDVTCLQHVTAIDYSHDGTQLIVSGYDCKILILRIDERAQEVRVNKVIKICSNPYHVPCIAWASTADGHAIVTGSTDCKIRMVELPSGLPSECVFEGHSGEVCAIVLSPDKRVLASASHDHTLRLWDLDAKQPIDQPLPHPVKLSCAAFAADGNSVATGTFDGKIYVWDLLSRDVKGREKDANARHPFNPDSQIPATRRPVPRTRQPIKFDSKKFFGHRK